MYISTFYYITHNLCFAVSSFASLQVEVSTSQNAQDLSIFDYHYEHTDGKCSSSFTLVILAKAVILLPNRKEIYLLILSHSHNSVKHWMKQNAVFWIAAVSTKHI